MLGASPVRGIPYTGDWGFSPLVLLWSCATAYRPTGGPTENSPLGATLGYGRSLGLLPNSAQKRRTRNSGRAITATIEIENTIAAPAVAMISSPS